VTTLVRGTDPKLVHFVVDMGHEDIAEPDAA